MSNLQQLSDVQVLLLAARFISDVNIDSLRILASERRDVLTQDIIYRLLITLYPTDDTARAALLTLLRSIRTDFDDVSSLDGPVDASAVNLSPEAAISEAQHLHLNPISDSSAYPIDSLYGRFVRSWAHRLESTGGPLEAVASLIQESADGDESLSRWANTYLLPLLRLQYEYYPGAEGHITLHELERLSGLAGVRSLLQYATAHTTHYDIARDIDNVVALWIGGYSDERPTAKWADVYTWILETSFKDFGLTADAFLTWNGPPGEPEANLRTLAHVGYAIIYANENVDRDRSVLLRRIWERSTSLAGLIPLDLNDEELEISANASDLTEAFSINLLQSNLLSDTNSLTQVSKPSSDLLAGVLRTRDILESYKVNRSIPAIAKICLGASAERQKHELAALLQQIPRLTAAEPDWHLLSKQLNWLHSWRPSSQTATVNGASVAFLGQLAVNDIDAQLLDAILATGQHQAVKQIFLASSPTSLELPEIESHIVNAIYNAYDNASNGNRNRGGVKKASDALNAFKSSFPQSPDMQAIEHLLKATHRLSFYQLVLQHGVPFRPVNIRAQKDPVSLIEKVLEQDPVAYSKLDDLVEVGRELVLSRPLSASENEQSTNANVMEAERRVTFLAVASALSNHDFNTAYSYITTRLLSMQRSEAPGSTGDDISWRAAYAAGRYRPPTSPSSLHDQISSLSKRMELLSSALTLAPTADSLPEILGTWRRCEEEMDGLRSTALQEERAFDTGGSRELPGGFGLDDREWDQAETRQAVSRRNFAGASSTYEEEAPMGLFEMARGAASSLRKNAFPLNAAAGGHGLKIQSRPSQDLDEDSRLEHDGDRVRKRDMVSNMVTSGLVSGMGWVLGAQPTQQSGRQ